LDKIDPKDLNSTFSSCQQDLRQEAEKDLFPIHKVYRNLDVVEGGCSTGKKICELDLGVIGTDAAVERFADGMKPCVH